MEGIEYLREYLHLPEEIVPATLKKSASRPARPGPAPGGKSGYSVAPQPLFWLLIKQCANVSGLCVAGVFKFGCFLLLVNQSNTHLCIVCAFEVGGFQAA